MEIELVEVKAKHCRELLLNHHYAKRMVGSVRAFAVLDGLRPTACVIYSKPASYTLCEGVCGKELKKHVIELSRLVILGNEKNAASQIISKSLKLLGDQIVVSYADPTAGHVGYVYQATNWLYTGRGNAEPWWVHPATGEVISKTRRHIDRKAEAIGLDWQELIKQPKPGKHRYVTFTGNKRFRKLAHRELRYVSKPYPKQ